MKRNLVIGLFLLIILIALAACAVNEPVSTKSEQKEESVMPYEIENQASYEKAPEEYTHKYEEDVVRISYGAGSSSFRHEKYLGITTSNTDLFLLEKNVGIRKIGHFDIASYLPNSPSTIINSGDYDGIDYASDSWGIVAYSNDAKKIYIHAEHSTPDKELNYPSLKFYSPSSGNYYWTTNYEIYDIEAKQFGNNMRIFIRVKRYPVYTRIEEFEYSYSNPNSLTWKSRTDMGYYESRGFAVNGSYIYSSSTYIYPKFFRKIIGNSTRYMEKFSNGYTEHGHSFFGYLQNVSQDKMDYGKNNAENQYGYWLLDMQYWKSGGNTYYYPTIFWLPYNEMKF